MAKCQWDGRVGKIGLLFKLCGERENFLFDTLGRYYLLDTRTNMLVDSHFPLERYAKDLGVLSVHEQLEA